MRKWTERELIFLIRWSGSVPSNLIGKALGRTDSAVRSKISQHGLKQFAEPDFTIPICLSCKKRRCTGYCARIKESEKEREKYYENLIRQAWNDASAGT